MSPILGIIASGIQNSIANANSYESISTVTVGAGGSSSVTISSIPSTYTHLQLRVFAQTNRVTYGRDYVFLRFNGDTGANYAWHQMTGDGSATVSSGNASQNQGIFAEIGTSTGGTFGVGITDILDYTDTSKYKTTRTLGGGDHNGTIGGFGGTVTPTSTLWQSTSAVSSLTLFPSSGTAFTQYSSFALYGIKG